MKLLKTINKLVLESQEALEKASEMGVNEKELDRLEKNYRDSLKLMSLIEKMKSSKPKENK